MSPIKNDERNWFALSSDADAFDLLMENPDKIIWREFCRNPSPRAFAHLLRNPDKISWDVIEENPFYFLFEVVNSLKELRQTWNPLLQQPVAQ